jgi:predicted amidohydrolase
MDGGYEHLSAGTASLLRSNSVIAHLRKRSTNSYLIAGSLYVDGRNSSLVFHRGRLVHRYDKMHLFRHTGDDRYFIPGKRARTFLIHRNSIRIRAGIVICYDLRFPELVRTMALQGMDVLFVPARWPVIRDDSWRTLLKARAIENQIFVVGCNARGPEGGYSYAFGPTGDELYSSRKRRRESVIELPLEELEKARRFSHGVREARMPGSGKRGKWVWR